MEAGCVNVRKPYWREERKSMAIFERGIWNAWILSLLFMVVPLFALAVFGRAGKKKEIAKRMSDMTGFTLKEKIFTVLASAAPYPFMLATVWMPFTTMRSLLYVGLLLYISGLLLFGASLRAIFETPPDQPFSAGPYRISRNPVYIGAMLVFAGICAATANLALVGYLAVAAWLQHFMILAEERICREKYGKVFEEYMKRAPRYFFMRAGRHIPRRGAP